MSLLSWRECKLLIPGNITKTPPTWFHHIDSDREFIALENYALNYSS